ncbi:MAG: HEAT repeat domain-containing protein [Phycisphaerae bacterium]|jgi:HEAT repeat protein
MLKRKVFNLIKIPSSVAVCLALFTGFVLFSGCEESNAAVKLPGEKTVRDLQPRALTIISQALVNPDPQIRAKAIEVVAAAGQKQLMAEVQKLLGDDYVPVRYNAAVAIGDMEFYLAKSTVEKLLPVADENTKIAAAYAMYKLGYKDYLELIKSAVASPDQTLRANAVVLLGKTGDKSVLEILYWAKDNDNSDPKVRYQATEAIAKLGDETIVPKIWTMLVSKFVEAKMIGIYAMGALGTPQAKEVLFTKLDDDILEVRLAAAEQLASLGDNSGEQAVLSVFQDKLTADLDQQAQERVLVLTALAIGKLNTPDTISYLPKLIDSDSMVIRLASAQAVLEALNSDR